MKLPIKKEFFDKIKSGEKVHEFRDAHITFICEETAEEARVELVNATVMPRCMMPKELRDRYDLCDTDEVIRFVLMPGKKE